MKVISLEQAGSMFYFTGSNLGFADPIRHTGGLYWQDSPSYISRWGDRDWKEKYPDVSEPGLIPLNPLTASFLSRRLSDKNFMPGIKTFHLTYCSYRDIIKKMEDLVDIFAGSNTTGAVAESSSRRWIAFEKQQDYLVVSAFRFLDNISESEIKAIYEQLRRQGTSNVRLPQRMQAELPL